MLLFYTWGRGENESIEERKGQRGGREGWGGKWYFSPTRYLQLVVRADVMKEREEAVREVSVKVWRQGASGQGTTGTVGPRPEEAVLLCWHISQQPSDAPN